MKSILIAIALAAASAAGQTVNQSVATGASSATGAGVVRSSAAAGSLRVIQENNTASVTSRGSPLVEYRYVESPRKPYVSRLFSPAGVQVLRDSPQDHRHHHALMFALAADGVDFWSEKNGDGSQSHQPSTGKLSTQDNNGTGRARFTHALEWIDPNSHQAVVAEQRRIETCRAGDLDATLLTWESILRPPAGKQTVALTGSHYFGLGMRFVSSMDAKGRFFNSEGQEGELVRGTERLVPARWCAYSAMADGKPATVAVFDHPNNPRHPARMFTMTAPFAYLGATLNLWKEPYTLVAGRPLRLRYGIALWDGEVAPARVQSVYQRWVALESE